MTIRTAVLTLLLVAQTQTPAQIIDQLQNLLNQLKTSISSTPSATVSSSADLVAALKNGGAINLAPGTYSGNFVITKATTLTGPATLVAADGLTPTLQVQANDVVVRNLSVQLGNPDRDAIVVGSLTATSADALPHRVLFESVTVLPSAQGGGHRGFALHGSDITLKSVTVTGFYEKGRDSQAVWICNGPGPFTVVDSTLEASGENFLVGGADPGIVGTNPSNITVRGNTLRKPDSFRTLGTVKNSFELKTGLHVLFENNVIDGNWLDGQGGTPIVITVRNSSGGCPWCQVDDVTIRGNTVKRSKDGFSVNILGMDDGNISAQTQTLTIDHNLFAEAPGGIQVLNGVAKSLVVTNNTFPAITDKFLQLGAANRPKVMTPLTFARNVLKTGAYGIMGDGSTGPGLASLTSYATVVDFTGNVIEMTNQRTISLPPGNQIVTFGGLAALLNPTTFKLLNGTAGY